MAARENWLWVSVCVAWNKVLKTAYCSAPISAGEPTREFAPGRAVHADHAVVLNLSTETWLVHLPAVKSPLRFRLENKLDKCLVSQSSLGILYHHASSSLFVIVLAASKKIKSEK